MMNRVRTRSDEAASENNSQHGGTSVNGDMASTIGDSQSGGVPDMMLLNLYCARAKAPKETAASQREAAESWQPVREWLQSHDYETVRAAAEQRGESGLTALHFCCRNVPPADVIDVFLSIAADTVQWPDSFGWLPIHYACASGSDTAVIQALAENFPESKTTTDRRGRTPLHFALGDKPASPDSIFLLSSTGAASYPDEIGMLVCKNSCVCVCLCCNIIVLLLSKPSLSYEIRYCCCSFSSVVAACISFV
jgi:Ankyrin repeats (3 copies)